MSEMQHTQALKNHLLSLAQKDKVMKSKEDIRMISSKAPMMLIKVYEIFVLNLTHCA